MQVAANAVARVVLHHREAMGLHVVLNGAGDIEQAVAGLDLAQSLHERFLGHFGQLASRLRGLLTDADGDAAVAVIAVEIGAGIHLEQIAGLDHPLIAGDAMHHLVIDRSADTGREAVVALETGHRPELPDAALGVAIQIAGAHPRRRQLLDLPQHSGHDATGAAHDLQLAGRLDLHAATPLLNSGSDLQNGAFVGR